MKPGRERRRERIGREYFERLYAGQSDPWDFETSDYESGKYAKTIAALGERHFASALEIGCSIGVFTTMLSARCEALLAVDASEKAVGYARDRTQGNPVVTVERRTVPEEMPDGKFDLVVASEILYYLPKEIMLKTLGLMEDALHPGGLLLAVHWRGETKTYPLQGDEAHLLIRENTALRPVLCEREPEYLLDIYEKRTPGVQS